MQLHYHQNNIPFYVKINPNITADQIGILLLIEHLYKDVPSDIARFRQNYVHLDPAVIDTSADGITFLKIAHQPLTPAEIKQALNDYLNIKYNCLDNVKSYDENMAQFSRHSQIASTVINDVLARAAMPRPIIDALQEHPRVRRCEDIHDLIELYQSDDSRRVRFEILRKIGLIVLISRIDKRFMISDLDRILDAVKRLLHRGLCLSDRKTIRFYYWLDDNDKVDYHTDEQTARARFEAATRRRASKILPVFHLNCFVADAKHCIFDCTVLHIEIRNKLGNSRQLSYTSYIEKMIRKNFEFPNQVLDVIGVKMVVKNEAEVLELIKALETFLGGSSIRKHEKNALHKFGRKKLSKYSSNEYFVWKAIYDLTLPHPFSPHLADLIEKAGQYPHLQKMLTQQAAHWIDKPLDVVVEIQIQDIDSYLQSIAPGSSSQHAALKMNQIRANSFCKFFPEEIYADALFELRNQILQPEKSITKSRYAESQSF